MERASIILEHSPNPVFGQGDASKGFTSVVLCIAALGFPFAARPSPCPLNTKRNLL